MRKGEEDTARHRREKREDAIGAKKVVIVHGSVKLATRHQLVLLTCRRNM